MDGRDQATALITRNRRLLARGSGRHAREVAVTAEQRLQAARHALQVAEKALQWARHGLFELRRP